MKLRAYIDGGSRGNPGEAGAGIYVPGLVGIAEYLGPGRTNNFAEYAALISAARFAALHKCTDLEVLADSELVVKQIKGEYKVRNESIQALHEAAGLWIDLLPRFSIQHVRREDNKEADKLANLAMDRRRHVIQWL